MRYRILNPGKALEVLDSSRRGEPIDESSYQYAGQGEELDRNLLDGLVRQLRAIKRRFPEVLRDRDPRAKAFEAEACIHLHRTLPRDATMLADYDFWTWLAVFVFRELVDWRHGGTKGEAKPANFGIGKRDENLLFRMWARADIGYDPSNAADPYDLARRGDQDFWRAHVLRQGYGASRTLVRALIRFQFPEGADGSATLKGLEIREFVKRLKRLNANVLFECMHENDVQKVFEREAEAARSAVAESGE